MALSSFICLVWDGVRLPCLGKDELEVLVEDDPRGRVGLGILQRA